MTAKTTDDLTARLKRLFMAAAEDLAAAVKRGGHTLAVTTRQSFVVREDNPENYKTESRVVARNVLDYRVPPEYGRDDAVLSDELAAEALDIAGVFAALPEAHLPFFAPFSRDILIPRRETPLPAYHEDPADWVRGNLLLPSMYAHLESLASLGAVSDQHAERFADEVLTFAAAPGMTYRTVVPLAGIRLESGKKELRLLDGVKLRHLTADEEANLAQAHLRDVFSPFSLPLYALELDCVTGRLDSNPDVRPLMEPWLNAFELLGHQITGKHATTRSFPEWVGIGTGHLPLNIRRITRQWSVVTEVDAVELVRIVREFKKYDLKEKKTATHALALHRYHLGMAKESDVESLLDFVISLEAILLPRDGQVGHSDLSYRFRVHGAHYLASTADERHDVYKRMGDLYGLRSTLVHGGKYPDDAKIREARGDAESFARKALNRALREGFPGAHTFLGLVLGERTPTDQ
ncbi:hypothetical protein GCM10023084_53970 [Streptomyces lacrimifluminis]|uniref:Apea-like HEPN domain-containing protein n=1 Tax=Streptomyces lacrimifluminis TaxID=1500077 RepID=A0A917NVW9_9ACTN|nr:HEPN domain-containing protein [Streptomyces lacrimifluminis]GGJ34365.1 hypothetical protein GCM10012282_33890 [Streptomyces lacrimifluminis]